MACMLLNFSEPFNLLYMHLHRWFFFPFPSLHQNHVGCASVCTCAHRLRQHKAMPETRTYHTRCVCKKKKTTIHFALRIFSVETLVARPVRISDLSRIRSGREELHLLEKRECVRGTKFNRLHACLPLAGIGSRCGAPNSISVYCWYKLSISAMHLNVRPLFGDGGAPWKCELCNCNRRLIRDDTSKSLVWMYCGSAEYIYRDEKRHKK